MFLRSLMLDSSKGQKLLVYSVRSSIRPTVRPSVRPTVRPSDRPSVLKSDIDNNIIRFEVFKSVNGRHFQVSSFSTVFVRVSVRQIRVAPCPSCPRADPSV